VAADVAAVGAMAVEAAGAGAGASEAAEEVAPTGDPDGAGWAWPSFCLLGGLLLLLLLALALAPRLKLGLVLEPL
jgi:hypothetical protein